MNSQGRREAEFHVMDQVLDYLAGELGDDDARAFRKHLERCEDCRLDFETAEALHQNSSAQGLRHLHPDRMVALAEARSPRLSREEEDHLALCNSCKNELGFLRELPDPPELLATTPAGTAEFVERREASGGFAGLIQQFFRKPAWGLGTALAAAACVLLLLQPWAERPGEDLERLVQVEPLPVRLNRAPADPLSFAGMVTRALEAYADENYAAAAERFERALVEKPDSPEVKLYLGSTQLMLGHSREAIEPLRAAADSAPEHLVANPGRWLLANAHLMEGDAAQAQPLLQALATGESEYAARAEALLRQLAP